MLYQMALTKKYIDTMTSSDCICSYFGCHCRYHLKCFLKQLQSGLHQKQWKCDGHSKQVFTLFITDNCGFPIKKYNIPNIDEQGTYEERFDKFTRDLKQQLTLVHRVCQDFKIHFGSVMLSLQQNIAHIYPKQIKTIMAIEEEIASLQQGLREHMSNESKQILQCEIEAKTTILITARNESNAGQEIVNLHNKMMVLERTLSEQRSQTTNINLNKITSSTIQLTLLQDSYNDSISWLKIINLATFEHLQLPDTINIIDLSESDIEDVEDQVHEEGVDQNNSSNDAGEQSKNNSTSSQVILPNKEEMETGIQIYDSIDFASGDRDIHNPNRDDIVGNSNDLGNNDPKESS